MLSWVLQVELQQGDRWDLTDDVVDAFVETCLSRPRSWSRDRSFQDGCRYLPPEIAQHDAEETQAREPLILKLLSSNLAKALLLKALPFGVLWGVPPGPSLRTFFLGEWWCHAAPDLAHVLKNPDKYTKIKSWTNTKKHEKTQPTSSNVLHTKEPSATSTSSVSCQVIPLLPLRRSWPSAWDVWRTWMNRRCPQATGAATGWDQLETPSILWGICGIYTWAVPVVVVSYDMNLNNIGVIWRLSQLIIQYTPIKKPNWTLNLWDEVWGHQVWEPTWAQAWTSRSLCAPPFGLCSWPVRTPVAPAVRGRSMAMPIAPRSWTTSGPGCAFWTWIIIGPSGGNPSVRRRGMRLSRSPSSSPNWMCAWCCACWLKRSGKVPEQTVPLITPRDGAWMLIKTSSYFFTGFWGFYMATIYGFILFGKIHWTHISLICFPPPVRWGFLDFMSVSPAFLLLPPPGLNCKL